MTWRAGWDAVYRSPSLDRLVSDIRDRDTFRFGPRTREERLLYLAVLAVPVAWVFGFAEFIWPVLTMPLVFELMRGGRLQIPRFFILWLVFLGLAVASMLSQLLAFSGVWWLFGGYVSATVMFLFVFNSDAEAVSDRALVEVVALFWVIVAVSGIIGVGTRDAAVPSATEAVLPSSLVQEVWVQRLIEPRLSEPNRPEVRDDQLQVFDEEELGWADYRPNGIMTWANDWGSVYAATLPAVLLLLYRPLKSSHRRWILMLLALSLLPFVLSRNRWVWITLPVVALYAAARFWRPNRKIAFSVLGVLVAGALLVAVTPLSSVLNDRLSSEGSEAYRGELYRYGFERIVDSPLLGFGETVDVEPNEADKIRLGPDSQVVHTMIIHGLPALGLLFIFFGFGIAISRRMETSLEASAHFLILFMVLHSAFYVIVPMHQLHLLMLVMAGAARYRYVTHGSFRYRPVVLFSSSSDRRKMARSYRNRLQ